jgi:hypothetical protein
MEEDLSRFTELPDWNYIKNNKQLFNSHFNRLQQEYITSGRIGYVTMLRKRYKPKSCAEFYKVYLKDGELAEFYERTGKGDPYHGRTLRHLYILASLYHEKAVKVIPSLAVDDCFWNIVIHAIIETMSGCLAELAIIDYLKHNIPNVTVTQITLGGDAEFNIDIAVVGNDKHTNPDVYRRYIQVKPVSTFLGKGPGLVEDRAEFYEKQESFNAWCIKNNRPDAIREIDYVVYDTNYPVEDLHVFVHKNMSPYFKLSELCDRDGKIVLDFRDKSMQSVPLRSLYGLGEPWDKKENALDKLL